MKIRELITMIGFDVDNKTLKDVDTRVSNLKKGLIGLTSLVGVSSVALMGLVRSAANAGDRITDTASAIGVSTEALQELGFAATLSGSNVETMANGLRLLSKNLTDAAANPTSDLAKKFKQLGVNVKDNNGQLKSADVVFRELSDGFVKITNPAEKVNLAMTLLGKSGANLIQTLDNGSEGLSAFAAELQASGSALSEKQLENLGRFNDEWDRLGFLTGGLKNAIGAELAPVLTEIIKSISRWFQANGKLIKSSIVPFLKGMAGFLKVILSIGLRIGEMFLSLTKIIGGVEVITKGLMLVMAALFGAGIIMGLRTLTLGFIKLGASIFASLLPILPFALLMAAIFAGIFLIIEDLYTYFTGGDSVFGMMMKSATTAFEYVRDLFNEYIVWPIQGFFNKIGSFLPENLADKIQRSLNTQGVVADITPQSRPIQSAINNANNQVRVNAPITVNVPSGTDPAMVGDRIESGMGNALDDIFNEVQRYTGPTLRY